MRGGRGWKWESNKGEERIREWATWNKLYGRECGGEWKVKN